MRRKILWITFGTSLLARRALNWIDHDFEKLLAAGIRSAHRCVADDRPLRIRSQQIENVSCSISPGIEALSDGV